jgi:hypothetical protein
LNYESSAPILTEKHPIRFSKNRVGVHITAPA